MALQIVATVPANPLLVIVDLGAPMLEAALGLAAALVGTFPDSPPQSSHSRPCYLRRRTSAVGRVVLLALGRKAPR